MFSSNLGCQKWRDTLACPPHRRDVRFVAIARPPSDSGDTHSWLGKWLRRRSASGGNDEPCQNAAYRASRRTNPGNYFGRYRNEKRGFLRRRNRGRCPQMIPFSLRDTERMPLASQSKRPETWPRPNAKGSSPLEIPGISWPLRRHSLKGIAAATAR